MQVQLDKSKQKLILRQTSSKNSITNEKVSSKIVRPKANADRIKEYSLPNISKLNKSGVTTS